MEKSLDKLGTVLGVLNDINTKMLDKLEQQQKRQTRIIWFSIATIALAFIIVGWTVFLSFRSIDRLTNQVEQNRITIEHNREVLRRGDSQKISKAVPE